MHMTLKLPTTRRIILHRPFRKSPDISSQMDWMLKEMQKMRVKMKAGQEENVLKLAWGAKRGCVLVSPEAKREL